ncbi:MAG: RnfABCDGE type electron transport complex subunit G [Alkalispirochaeta sp.]
MKKLESTLPNMFLVLTVIALVSAAALGFTYAQTKPILDEQARQREIQAVADVVPEFDNNPTEESVVPAEFPDMEIYPATRQGNRVGTAVRTYSSNAYGGDLRVMVGFDQDGAITGTTILQHSETPGLGAKLTEVSFQEQFLNLRPQSGALAVTKDGGRVDSLTAATISSRAFVEAVNRAWEAVEFVQESAPSEETTQ